MIEHGCALASHTDTDQAHVQSGGHSLTPSDLHHPHSQQGIYLLQVCILLCLSSCWSCKPCRGRWLILVISHSPALSGAEYGEGNDFRSGSFLEEPVDIAGSLPQPIPPMEKWVCERSCCRQSFLLPHTSAHGSRVTHLSYTISVQIPC